MKEIYKKIQQIKTELDPISKDITNEFYKSSYFDINKLISSVENLFIEHNLLLLQPIIEGKVVTKIIDYENDQEITSSIELPEESNPQKIGSAITYYRRYSLQSLLGLQAADDDGNNASNNGDSVEVDDKQWLNVGSKEWDNAIQNKASLAQLRDHYKVSKANATQYEKEVKK